MICMSRLGGRAGGRMTHFARLEFIILSAAALVRAITAYGADLGKPVTFSNDVAPILQRSCQNCHRPGSIAPMSLLTYKEARPWAKAIKENVVLRNMPPWHIDPNIGISKFKNSVALSDQEIATIAQWVDSGAPKGDPA